jgi:microcystin degradation protein MlrC
MAPMRVVIAQMQHETNTFSPVPTPWEAFGKNGPWIGREAFEAAEGTRVPMAAFLDLARKERAQIVTPVAAWANPSGPVDGEAYDRICGLICDAVRAGCDAVFLDLHGAMVVEGRTDDGEGTLLERIRAIAPRTPIAVSLDLHANVTDRMVRNCTVIAGYKTYPHVDGYESGELAGSMLWRHLRGEIAPVMAWGNRPLLAHTLRQNTDEGAMRDFVNAARAAERNGMLAASAFGGFQLADIHDAGVRHASDRLGIAPRRRRRATRFSTRPGGARRISSIAAARSKRRSPRRGSLATRAADRSCCWITRTIACRVRRRTRCMCSSPRCAWA